MDPRLPEIQGELVNTIRETEECMRRLPRAPSNDLMNEVLQALNDFSRELFHRVKGTPDKDGLLQTIRPHQQAFRRAILRTAPNFVLWDKKKMGKKFEANFLQEEAEDESEEDDTVDEDAVDEEYQAPPAKKKWIEENIHIDEVLERANKYAYFILLKGYF